MSRSPTPAEIADAQDLLPGPDWSQGRVDEGGDDHLVLIPFVPADDAPSAVIRMARRPEIAALLPRRMDLLTRLAPHLPLALPEPLTVVATGARTGVAAVGQKYVPGGMHPPHSGDPAALQDVLEALSAVEESAWRGLVEAPFAEQPQWNSGQRKLVLSVLPKDFHERTERIWAGLRAMAGESTGLVHGDLAGDNMRWHAGRVIGVLDWDHAAGWDPAINLAQLILWHGPQVLAAAPDSRFADRASVWVGHLALLRLHDAATRQAAGTPIRRWSRLIRKTLPRLESAATAARRL